MNKNVMTGIASAMVSLGIFNAPVPAFAYSSYTRTYARQNDNVGIHSGDVALPYASTEKLNPGEVVTTLPTTLKTPALSTNALKQSIISDQALILSRPSDHKGAVPENIPDKNLTPNVELKTHHAVRELIIIDAAVEDKHTFYSDLKPGVDVREIKSGEDGLAQLQNALKNYSLLEAVHIVSHAADGEIYLGNTRVTEDLLRTEINTLSVIDDVLNDGADIHFYGCNLARTKRGDDLLELISQKANVDVAASNDFTGSAAHAGDWDLEITKGDISSERPFNNIALLDYSHVLFSGNINFSTVTNPGSLSGDSAAINAQFGGAGGYTLTLDGSGFSTYGGFGRGYTSYGESQITLHFSGEESFTPGSIYVYNVAGLADTFIATSDVGGYVNSGSVADLRGVTLNLSSFGADVTKVYISVQDGSGYFSVDNFNISDVAPVSVTNSDGNLTSSATVSEPVGVDSTGNTVGEAVNVFDFTVTDGGGGDSLALAVSQIVVNVSGTASETELANITWRLNGPDVSNVTGVYNAGADTITFSGLSVSIADNTSEVYTVNAYFNDNTGITEGGTFVLSVDGDSNLTVDGSGTQMAATTPVTNGAGGTLDIVATALAFTTQPAGSVSGSTLSTQPVVFAQDAFGNIDIDFTETITLTEGSAGALTGGSVAAVSGVATFPAVNYTATADQQSFTLTANDQDGVGSNLATVNANALTSDVVATTLAYTTQPNPLLVSNAVATSFTTVPVVAAHDANGLVDTGYTTAITLAEVNGAGSALLSATGDSDGNANTVTLTPTAGVATFTGLQITYTASGAASENFNLAVSSGALTTANSSQLTGLVPDNDGTLIAAGGVSEPIGLSYSIDTVGEAVDLFDFTLADAGSSDGLSMNLSQIVLNVSGTSTDAERAKVVWRLNGNDVSNVTGSYNAGADTITFSGLSISIADAANEVYTVNGYYSDNTGLTHGNTIILSVDGDTDLTLGSGTQMAATSAITNGTGTALTDNIAPVVTSVSVPANATYTFASNLNFTVNFDQNVTVNTAGGTPRLTLTLGATTRYASYLSGSGSSALTFRYSVQSGDEDSNGIAIASSVDANSGTLRDAAGNDITTTLNSVGSLASVLVDAVAPSLSEVTAVPSPDNDSTPSLTFSTSEAGTLAIGGSCGSADEGAVSSGSNTITLTQTDNSTALAAGTYADCTATVTDTAGNTSSALTFTGFTIDLTAPTVTEVTAVTTPANDSSPNVTISTTEAGTLSVGGSCGSASEGAIGTGNTTITLTQTDNSTALAAGSYADCTITVTDASGNANSPVTLTSFTVDLTAPTVAEITAVVSPGNDPTPDVTFSSSEAGALAVGGSCGSASEGAISAGNTTIALTQSDNSTALTAGSYADCTLTITDASGNANSPITLTSFTIDLTAPTVAEVAAVVTPGNDATPDVTISTTEAGTLSIGGSCGSASEGAISSGSNIITLTQADNSTALAAGTYADCTATVTDTAGNTSSALTFTGFTIDLTAPTVTEVTAVTTPANDSSPNVTISTTEAGTLSVGGSCGSASEGAIGTGNTTITLTQTDNSTALAAGSYADCTITVTDASGNANSPVTLTSFTVDLTAPTVAEITAVVSPGNDPTPDVTFSSSEAGALAVGGSCGSASEGAISAGNTTIALTQSDNSTALTAGSYADCTLTITDASGNANSPITLTSFTIDLTAPTVAEVAAVVTPGNDATPDVTISTTEAGTLSIGGSCGSASEGAISSGSNIITLTQADNSTALAAGTYADCSVSVVDASGNTSTPITLTSFQVDISGPTVAEVTAVTTPTSDTTPEVTISTTESGTLVVGGSCGSASEGAISSGNTTLTLTQADNSTALAGGSYSDCTVSITDDSGNASNLLTLATFTVDADSPTLAEVTAAPSPGNDGTPSVTFSSTEAGTLSVGGSCGSASEGAIGAGSQTISLTQADNSSELTSGSYSDCTLTVVDSAANSSAVLSLSAFIVDVSGPSLDTNAGTTLNEGDADVVITAAALTASDNISAAANVTYTVVSAPANGTLRLNGSALATASAFTQDDIANNRLSYDHDGGESTGDSIVFTLADALGNINDNSGSNHSFAITVTAQNDAPQTTVDTATINEDNAVMVNVLANDADSDDTINAASVTVVSAATDGATSVNTATGVITYTPNANFNGSDSFSYTVQDATGATSAITPVTITVNTVNDAPVALSDVVSTNINTAVTLNVVANDTDVDSGDAPDASSLAIVSAATSGSAVIVTGEVKYTPNSGFTGSDSYTYTVDDSYGLVSNVATVTITVIDPNVVPVASNDSTTTNEDTAIAVDVLANDSDGDGSLVASSVTVATAPGNGTTEVSTTTGAITYTPSANFNGSDSFTYTVEDDLGATSAAATVTVTVASVNDAPVAQDDTVSLLEDATLMINVLGNDSDIDGSLAPASVMLVSDPASGVVAVDPANGSVTYTPLDDFAGNDSFSYQVNDSDGASSNTATVSLTVDPVNDAPLANADTATVVIAVAESIDLLANDSDIDGTLDPTAITITVQPTQGTLVNHNDGTVTYTSNANADVTTGDSFSYTVDDNSEASSNAANVQIQFVPAAAPVVTGTPAADVEEEGDYSFTPEVTPGDSHFDLSYSVSGAPSWLDFDTTTGTLSGEPGADDVGVASGIQISVSDGVNTVALTPFDLTVVAREDTDSDTITNYQEGKDGTDPNNGTDYIDTTPPEITAPADIILDAVALYTDVTTAQLLGLAANADTSAVDTAMAALVSDNVDGNGCCNLFPLGAVIDKYKLAPGVNNIVWQASDNKNNISEVTQKVYVRPLVSVSKDSTNVEGGVARITLLLNGKAPFYPLQIPYLIDSASTASSADHDLVAGVATLNFGETSVQLSVNIVSDSVAENDEQLIVRLDDRTTNAQDLADGFEADLYDINAGARTVNRLTIVERNIAPQVALEARQNGVVTLLVTADAGPVTLSSAISDPNSADTHTYSWSSRRGNLSDTDGNSTDGSFVFSPSSLANGVYKIALTVTDNEGATDTETINVVIVSSAPTLAASTDSDGDGIDDQTEGTADTDRDGIPDYLDNITANNVVPEAAAVTDAFLLECDPGVQCRLGRFAQAGRSGGARLNQQDIAEQEELIDDTDFTLAGDLFDFEIADLPIGGQSVSVVIPLQEPIPENGVYRKLSDSGWSTFVEDASNSLHSSSGELGFCPPPGATEWQPGLVPGHLCLQLTIEDGGPNDADGIANANVEDPGGIAVQNTQTVNTRGGGGSVGPLLVLLLGGLAWANRKKRQLKLPGHKSSLAACIAGLTAFSLPSEKTYALNWKEISQNSFAEVSVARATSSQNERDFTRAMASDGVAVNTTQYDTSSTALHVLWGYNYNQHLAATMGYLDLGSVTVDFEVPAGSGTLPAALKNNYPLTGSGLTLGARYNAELFEALLAFAEVGAFVWQGDVVSAEGSANTKLDGSVDPYFSVGAMLPLNEDIMLGLRHQRLYLDGQTRSNSGLVIQIHF